MARLKPYSKREEGTKKQFLGKILLFCEGTTESNYFDYFKTSLGKNITKYSNIEIQCENVKGNAKTVLNYAENFLDNDNNASIYKNHEKYLVFDCDDPPNIQEVINDMKSSDHEYILLPTNLLFETWLLMHFEIVDEKLTKRKTEEKLCVFLNIKKYTSKIKASPGIIAEVIGNGDNIKAAIENAKTLEKKYSNKYKIENDINEMNPYTTVHNLVEKILLEIQ